MNIDLFFKEISGIIESELDRLIPSEDQRPEILHRAMRWSLFAGGKRFRPALLFAVGRTFNAVDDDLAVTAAALEMLHTYSLIHDDLPSMDDDDLRRGRATCHIKFGESAAILAGDALQALAFQTIAEDKKLDNETRLKLASELGKAAAAMVAGQQLDLDAEGKHATLAEMEDIHRHKTGALITFSAVAGAMIAKANSTDIETVRQYGEKIGLLFQVVDDILDITETTETLGKTAGKDQTTAKASYPNILGVEKANQIAETLCVDAVSLAETLPNGAELLSSIAVYLLRRRS